MTRSIGQRGEAIAALYLQTHGCSIISHNWRCAHGEIDLIVREGQTLVFVEVRTRHASSTEPAFESLTPAKQRRMAACAAQYLTDQGMDEAEWRIDAVAVALRHGQAPVIEHLRDVLDW
jgi:putative endonuclease